MPKSFIPLLGWPVKMNAIIVRDFNFHHKLWEPNISRSSGVGSFIYWIDKHFLRLALLYGTHTYRAGYVLDLALKKVVLLSRLGFGSKISHEKKNRIFSKKDNNRCEK